MRKSRLLKAEIIVLVCVAALWGVNLKTNCVPRAAAGALRQMVKVAPNNRYAYELLGMACDKCGQDDESSEAYHRADEIEEIEIAKKAVRSAPNDPNAHFALGRAYYDANDFTRAIGSYQKAICLDPKFRRAYMDLGDVYASSRQYEASIGAYKKAASLDPNDSSVHVKMAFTYNDMRMYDESIAEWEHAIELEPDVASWQVLLADTYKAVGRYEDARAAYQQALAINPKGERAQRELSKLAAAKAVTYVDSAITNFRSDDYEGAIRAGEEAIKLQPDNAEAYLLIGGSYFQLDQCDKAITCLKKVCTLIPAQPKTMALAHFQLGTIYGQVGKTDLAMRECEILKALDTKMAEELHTALTKNSRDLSTPSSRLDGVWMTDGAEGGVEYRLTDPSLKVGVFRLHYSTGGAGPWTRFKILSEEPSGDKLIIREFRPFQTTELLRQLDPHFQWSPVTLCIPKDGRSMTREYEFLRDSMLQVYRYVESSGTAEQQASKAARAGANVSEHIAPSVEAIGVSTDKRPYALVDGTLVYEGSIVNGFRIVKIYRDKVEFEKNGQVSTETLN